MSGWRTYQRFQDLEERAAKKGFQLSYPKHNYGQDYLSLQPAGDQGLPSYSRDAEIFVGTLDEVERWLNGYEHAFLYLKMIKATSDKKIERCEQNIRNELLALELKK